ncbi:hypothetical protein C8R43DRAFT_1211654 [Mycena crocata]|nr:hypothetical protein C8R43DRAFT_1211654 [Mycena crocata]
MSHLEVLWSLFLAHGILIQSEASPPLPLARPPLRDESRAVSPAPQSPEFWYDANFDDAFLDMEPVLDDAGDEAGDTDPEPQTDADAEPTDNEGENTTPSRRNGGLATCKVSAWLVYHHHLQPLLAHPVLPTRLVSALDCGILSPRRVESPPPSPTPKSTAATSTAPRSSSHLRFKMRRPSPSHATRHPQTRHRTAHSKTPQHSPHVVGAPLTPTSQRMLQCRVHVPRIGCVPPATTPLFPSPSPSQVEGRHPACHAAVVSSPAVRPSQAEPSLTRSAIAASPHPCFLARAVFQASPRTSSAWLSSTRRAVSTPGLCTILPALRLQLFPRPVSSRLAHALQPPRPLR